MNLTDTTTSVPTADGPMPLYVVTPDRADGRYPGLIVCQEAFGVNEHIRDVCGRFAALGYVVVAPHLFHRQIPNDLPPVLAYDEIDTAKQVMAKITAEQIVADVGAAQTFLQRHDMVDPDRIAVIGYCWGGKCSYVAATRLPGLIAAVVYYGGGIVTGAPGAPVDDTAGIECPVLAVFGGKDPMIQADHVRSIDNALEAAQVDHLVVTYGDAGHAFNCDARPANYHAESAAAAWELTIAFLAAAFAGTPRPAATVAATIQ